jgi:hypothetical protein
MTAVENAFGLKTRVLKEELIERQEAAKIEGYKKRLIENGYEKENDSCFSKGGYSVFSNQLKLTEAEFVQRMNEVDELIRVENDKRDIKIIFTQRKRAIENLEYNNISHLSDIISVDFEGVKLKYCPEFKELVDLNISNIENLLTKKISALEEENKLFLKSEETRIANEKKAEKLKEANNTKAITIEKKRQQKLKPFKKYAIEVIGTLTADVEFASLDIDVNGILKDFNDELKTLQSAYLKRVKEL